MSAPFSFGTSARTSSTGCAVARTRLRNNVGIPSMADATLTQIRAASEARSGGARSGGNETGLLAAVFADQEFGNFRFQLPVVGMNRRSQSCLRRIASPNSLQDSLQVAHAVGLVDVLDRSQGLAVRE